MFFARGMTMGVLLLLAFFFLLLFLKRVIKEHEELTREDIYRKIAEKEKR